MNIYDYLTFYKNKSTKEINWNIMDNLILAIIVYLPIESFNTSKNFSDFACYANKFYQENLPGAMAPCAYKVLNIIKDSKRYSQLLISDFMNIINTNTQFGAMCAKIDNIKIVAFKGSNKTLISWLENIRLAYMPRTYTDTLAIDYLNKHITSHKERIFVTGHSKGGHLALISTLCLKKNKLAKISKIYNFDGPGLLKEDYLNPKYQELQDKLVNIVPTGSVVGMCLNNQKYLVVKSANIAFNEHYPDSWQMFGEFFLTGELSLISKQIHENTTTSLERLDRAKLKSTIEQLSSRLSSDYTSSIHFDITKIKENIKNMQGIDPDIYKYLLKILETMLNISKNS